ncbi:hypothetical protein [Streptomyces altiplanensis]
MPLRNRFPQQAAKFRVFGHCSFQKRGKIADGRLNSRIVGRPSGIFNVTPRATSNDHSNSSRSFERCGSDWSCCSTDCGYSGCIGKRIHEIPLEAHIIA